MAAALRSIAEQALGEEDEDVRECLLDEAAPIEAPIKAVADKWKLLPAFLKVCTVHFSPSATEAGRIRGVTAALSS